MISSFLPQFILTILERPYAEWLDYVLQDNDVPLSISTSYGDDEQTGMYLIGSPKTYALKSPLP